MDVFSDNLSALINTSDFSNPNLLGLRILKDISVIAHTLKYDVSSEKSLEILSNVLLNGHYFGESYKAASCLSSGRCNDNGGILSIVNRIEPQKKSLMISLEIVSYCNVRCPLCTNDKQSGKDYYLHGKIMPFPVFKKIWDDIGQYTGMLILVGQGETFLHPDIYKILDYVKPTPVHIDTNGNAMIDAERVIGSSVKRLLFSVDGVDQRTYGKYRVGGDFEKALDNMRGMVAAKKKARTGPDIVWKFILFKHTEPYCDEFKRLGREIGVDEISYTSCVVSPDNYEGLIREFMPVGISHQDKAIKYIDFANRTVGMNDMHDSPYCQAGLFNPHIRVNGDINICCSSYDPVGNVLEGGFFKNWNNPEYVRQRKQSLANRYALPECRACSRIQLNFGHLFDGTVMEYQKPAEPDPDRTLWVDDLKIEPDYLAYLEENGLTKDINYFKARGVISDAISPPPAGAAAVRGNGMDDAAVQP
ncbi:MAG: SPASM domain-containing protein [Deltaproteobacteria bacterium]|jgi:MoaA/NifB/PqqE/SkfB family radical SAM enzyme|nr:SPASM domain-containing protein [Deltaproteobacteria bacterium]